jgi:hypothetical protein
MEASDPLVGLKKSLVVSRYRVFVMELSTYPSISSWERLSSYDESMSERPTTSV